MSQLQFEKMTVSSLESLLSRRDDKLLEHKLADEPNENVIDLFNNEINIIAETIKSKMENLSAGKNVQNEQVFYE